MSNELLIGFVMAGIFGALYVAGYFMNAPRAKRWEERIRVAGTVHCATCRSVGTLTARTTSSGNASSSNLVLACSSCGSHDWTILE